MTPDEIKDAIDLAVDCCDGAECSDDDVDRLCGYVSRLAHEAQRLRDLLPPSDDSEPVTTEWIKAVGLAGSHAVEDGSRFYVAVFPWGAVDLFHDPPRGAKGMKGCDACRMPRIKTRGDARRLAAVFGVKLQEGDQ